LILLDFIFDMARISLQPGDLTRRLMEEITKTIGEQSRCMNGFREDYYFLFYRADRK
jgi:hypothetical protein